MSPTIPSMATFPLPSPFSTNTPVVSPHQQKKGCSVSSCGQTRLADDCPRHLCRKHCVEQGGCSSKTHKARGTIPTLTPAFGSSSSAPFLSPPPPSPPLKLSSRLPDLAESHAVDPSANPRFSTHLLPIFTGVIAEQQQKAQQQRILDAQEKESAQKAKQRITIYSWTTEDAGPSVKFAQEFTWPHVVLDRSLLAGVGLLEAGERGDLRIYDELDIADWVAVEVGYVVKVQEGDRLFLKDGSLRTCIKFDDCLAARPQRTPHIHYGLAYERAYVRKAHKDISPLHSTIYSPSARSTSSTPSAQSPLASPSPTPLRLPSPSPTSAEDLADLCDSKKHWPADYFTVDIVQCIRASNSTTHRVHQRERTRQKVFLKHFPGVRFTPSTFSDQVTLWRKAPSSLREEYLTFGRCEEGLWSAFSCRARKALKKGKMKPEDTIEID